MGEKVAILEINSDLKETTFFQQTGQILPNIVLHHETSHI